MNIFRRLATWFVAAVLLAPAPAFADVSHAVFNAEGVWAIDVDHGACVASRTLKDGATFLLRAKDGQITFGLLADTPVKTGTSGRLQTEAYGFDFKPSFGDGGKTFYFDGEFSARAVAALRLATEVRLLVDGRLVEAMPFEGTGFEPTLDGVIACSKGAGGWWGQGVGAQPGDTGPRPDQPTGEMVLSKQGIWGVAVSESPGICVAQAAADEHTQIQVLAALGAMGFAVASDGDMPQGRKGRVETDDYAFDFKAKYGGARYMSAEKPFDKAATLALRRATWLRISIDGKPLVDVDLRDSGFMAMLDSVAACSRGQTGWWGAGARRPQGS
jgi:hypothetical protein